MPQNVLPLAHRFRYVVLLGAVVAGCSTNSSVWPAGNTQLGASPAANVRRSVQLSEGFGKESIQQTRARSWLAPDLKGGALNIYWGDYYNNTIAIYPRNGINPPEKGLITKGVSHPERLFVDDRLAVYATNIGNNTITVYKRHRTRPSLRISTGIDTPTGLTVDAAGTVYCASVGNDTITVYPRGQTTPSLTIPIAGSPEYLAIDGSGNLYVSYLGGSKGTGVMEFAPGSTTGKDLGLDMTGGEPWKSIAPAISSSPIITVRRSTSSLRITPSRRNASVLAAARPSGLSLSEKEHKLFASVLTNDVFTIQQIDYPKLTNVTTKLSTNAGNWPIAVSPDAVL